MAHASALDEDGAIVGINVTPLVDIILVILIIFMVSAELIKTQGIAVEKPGAATGGAVEQSSLTITLTADSTLYIDQTRTPDHEQAAALVRERVARNPAIKALITADTRIPYGEVVTVIDLLRGAGIRDFTIAVKPPG